MVVNPRWQVVDGQLRALEQMEAQNAGSENNTDEGQWLVRPTCPPSTKLVLRGGWIWTPATWQNSYGWFVESQVIDIADPIKISMSTTAWNYSYRFTQANWYIGAILIIANGWNPTSAIGWRPQTQPQNSIIFQPARIAFAGPMDYEEVQTALEAEMGIAETSLQKANDVGTPVSGIVLRNNGNVLGLNQWMPIESANRGGSYLYRPIHMAWEMA